MKILRYALLILAALFLAAQPGQAQVQVVTTCGTMSTTQPAGTTGGSLTVDVNGQICGAWSLYPGPGGATFVVGAGTGTTGAVTGSLANTSGKTNYICGFSVSAIGGTATIGPITINNLIGNITFTFQAASTTTGYTLTQAFSPCIPAKATNTAIDVATTANGTASAVDVNVWGFQL